MDPMQAKIRARVLKDRMDLAKTRQAGRYLTLFLGCAVVGIYSFSMYKVKQESLLEEIDAEAGV